MINFGGQLEWQILNYISFQHIKSPARTHPIRASILLSFIHSIHSFIEIKKKTKVDAYALQSSAECHCSVNPCAQQHRIADAPMCVVNFHSQHLYQYVISMT